MRERIVHLIFLLAPEDSASSQVSGIGWRATFRGSDQYRGEVARSRQN